MFRERRVGRYGDPEPSLSDCNAVAADVGIIPRGFSPTFGIGCRLAPEPWREGARRLVSRRGSSLCPSENESVTPR